MSADLTCSACNGTGQYLYPSSGMNMGPGGQVMTTGPCPGTRRRPDETDCPFVLDEGGDASCDGTGAHRICPPDMCVATGGETS